jgi:hypothetical protein
MVKLEVVKHKAARLAQRRRDLSVAELRNWFERLQCLDPEVDNWPAFRSAYFDALWAGAEEMTARPVVPPTCFPKGQPLSASAHLTLAFIGTDRLELVDSSIELDDAV